MATVGKKIAVTQVVYVEVNDAMFTPEWMAEFRDNFYPFETIDDHLQHIAQLYARGLIEKDSFIEGYGEAKEVGIDFYNISQETEEEL